MSAARPSAIPVSSTRKSGIPTRQSGQQGRPSGTSNLPRRTGSVADVSNLHLPMQMPVCSTAVSKPQGRQSREGRESRGKGGPGTPAKRGLALCLSQFSTPNLTRISSATMLASTRGANRVAGPSGVQAFQGKDPRPFRTNKEYLQQETHFVWDMLRTLNGVEPTWNMRRLPSNKDFHTSLEQLLGVLCAGAFKYRQKPEDEIPRMLQVLRYPFQVKKSDMFNIGAPNSWPTLLAALAYLAHLAAVLGT